MVVMDCDTLLNFRRNPFHPFDDDTGLVRFADKMDTALFLFASNSKKHPNSMIFGRMFDQQVLDMAELEITNFVSASQFKVGGWCGVVRDCSPSIVAIQTSGCTLATKPCILLQGPLFESDETMKRIGNLMVGIEIGNSYQPFHCLDRLVPWALSERDTPPGTRAHHLADSRLGEGPPLPRLQVGLNCQLLF